MPMEISQIHDAFLQSGKVSIDTRKIEAGSMFVAIKGERFDANTFACEALAKGASFVIIDNPEYYVDYRTILVPDSLQTLQQLSNYHRRFLKLPIVALTGSNGKTTTKELINVVLSEKYQTRATVGNLNNHIGVPLTLLSFNSETEFGIVEMGANHQKEIEFLCKIAEPDYGYITNFGKAHLEGFGGTEGVIKGKSEMYDYLAAANKMVFANIDDPIQDSKTGRIRRYTFGQSSNADLLIESLSADPFVTVEFEGISVKSNLIGIYNAGNISAAIAMGKHFGISNDKIRSAIESYFPENNRSQLMQKNGNRIILDAYNANPSSMAAAIENLHGMSAETKIAILGDMFELGLESRDEHQSIVQKAHDTTDIHYFFVGKDFYSTGISNDRSRFFPDFESLTAEIAKINFTNSTILIKGSRGMALERILDFL